MVTFITMKQAKKKKNRIFFFLKESTLIGQEKWKKKTIDIHLDSREESPAQALLPLQVFEN